MCVANTCSLWWVDWSFPTGRKLAVISNSKGRHDNSVVDTPELNVQTSGTYHKHNPQPYAPHQWKKRDGLDKTGNHFNWGEAQR